MRSRLIMHIAFAVDDLDEALQPFLVACST